MALKKPAPAAPSSDDERRLARDLPGLLSALEAADPLARRWAARDLADHPDASRALVERLGIETEPSVSQVILTTLTRLGDEIAVAGLTECLRSEDAMLRNAAIEAMKQLPDEVAPVMEQLLKDHDPDVRIFAVDVLESLRHPRVEEWLIRVIAEDPHVNVCATAVDLLGEVGSERAVPTLHALKARFVDEPYIQFAADLALKRIAQG
ncbi:MULTISPECIES: HEAT repeat domain-containing protein [unclassified Marichromatium]|uniref:HEAT repeat domain-containing protein n=1 Tax=unclassified Marichromatium TaxID=2618417 RepID=UPI000F403829|nr:MULTISPECIES: HEAT repeat domain-containing protein [unclassified Marichromatium]RNE92248.1 HEAT repeat domain-containing protein [Marichromatium sp. AB31]RNE92651.1 HEAT repeat domain-containing protein [Marichromatium sp. AB32]